jgi:quercetin dioxygenase-like cupin family protein
MFAKSSEGLVGYRTLAPGISIRTLVYGDKTLMAEFRIKKGGALPRHAHPHEQTGYVVSGRIVLTLGEDRLNAGSGDSWCIAGGVEHEAVVLEDAVIVEVFSPVREDYLPDPVSGRKPGEGSYPDARSTKA